MLGNQRLTRKTGTSSVPPPCRTLAMLMGFNLQSSTTLGDIDVFIAPVSQQAGNSFGLITFSGGSLILFGSNGAPIAAGVIRMLASLLYLYVKKLCFK